MTSVSGSLDVESDVEWVEFFPVRSGHPTSSDIDGPFVSSLSTVSDSPAIFTKSSDASSLHSLLDEISNSPLSVHIPCWSLFTDLSLSIIGIVRASLGLLPCIGSNCGFVQPCSLEGFELLDVTPLVPVGTSLVGTLPGGSSLPS